MHMSRYVIVLECSICTRGHPLIYKFCTRYWTEREIRDGLKCMCAVVIIILDRVPTCVGAALSQIPTGFFATPACF